MNMGKRILSASLLTISAIVLLVGCTNMKGTPIRNNAEATPIPTKTELPSPTPSAAANTLPEGIIYEQDSKYYNSNGLEIDYPFYRTSPINKDCSVFSGFDDCNLNLESVIQYQGDPYAIWYAYIWDANPGYLILEVQPGTELMGMANQTMLAISRTNGEDFELIGHEPTSTGPFEFSHNGNLIAFEESGVPWIYTIQGNVSRFDPADYGFPEFEETSFSYPSWSLDDKTLVWPFEGRNGNTETTGLAVFDLENKTSLLLSPIDVTGLETPFGVNDHNWSPNGNFFTFGNDWDNVFYLCKTDGSFRKIDIKTSEYFHTIWNPDSTSFIIITDQEKGNYKNWIYQISNGELARLNLPEDARVFNWIEEIP